MEGAASSALGMPHCLLTNPTVATKIIFPPGSLIHRLIKATVSPLRLSSKVVPIEKPQRPWVTTKPFAILAQSPHPRLCPTLVQLSQLWPLGRSMVKETWPHHPASTILYSPSAHPCEQATDDVLSPYVCGSAAHWLVRDSSF